MTPDHPFQSPRLAALKRELDAGSATALPAFWREIRERGAPLVEPVDEQPDLALVTFLWRVEEPLDNVVVIGELVGSEFAANRLELLAGAGIWYKTYRFRADLRTCYELSPNDSLLPWSEVKSFEERSVTWQPDPLNPRRYRVNVKDEDDPKSFEKYLSVLELPAAPPQPYVSPRPGVPAGALELHRVRSATLGNERRVWAYTPPGYEPTGEPCGLLLMTDGIPYTRIMAAPTTLDNLIESGKVPPLVALFVDNPNRVKELGCNPDYTAFLARELVPWARGRYNIAGDPARVTIGGTSLGGLAAAFAGLRYPEVFGNVLSQSGAFQWAPEGDREYEWLVHQLLTNPPLPLRFYFDAGLLESEPWPPDSPSLLDSNRHLRDVLQAKGYPVHHLEFNGGHNYICWQGTLADGLLALMPHPQTR